MTAIKCLNFSQRIEVVRKIRIIHSLTLLYSESSVYVEEDPNRKKNYYQLPANYERVTSI